MSERRKGNLLIVVDDATGKVMSVRALAHGAAGIARAVTGTGGASAELIEQRTAICAACPHAVLSLGVLQRCDLCGCSTWGKVRNAGEKCPAGKW